MSSSCDILSPQGTDSGALLASSFVEQSKHYLRRTQMLRMWFCQRPSSLHLLRIMYVVLTRCWARYSRHTSLKFMSPCSLRNRPPVTRTFWSDAPGQHIKNTQRKQLEGCTGGCEEYHGHWRQDDWHGIRLESWWSQCWWPWNIQTKVWTLIWLFLGIRLPEGHQQVSSAFWTKVLLPVPALTSPPTFPRSLALHLISTLKRRSRMIVSSQWK